MIKIKNDLQLAASNRWRADFQKALAEVRRDAMGVPPRLRRAQVDGLRSQIEDLDREIAEYEALRRGSPARITFDSLDALPDALVRVRISRRLTQEDLARRLGVKPQQVQRWEAGAYAQATYATIRKVAAALKVDVKGRAAP
ncbi:MAG: helix-turn-helix transcriptional regulator [Chloroflexi bacterium]|nr:helix-turn-helix transcriptional regulator [Chloroflexota bacterium]